MFHCIDICEAFPGHIVEFISGEVGDLIKLYYAKLDINPKGFCVICIMILR